MFKRNINALGMTNRDTGVKENIIFKVDIVFANANVFGNLFTNKK